MFTHAAFRLFDTTYPAYRVFMLLTAIAMFAALLAVLARTRVGLIIQPAFGAAVAWLDILLSPSRLARLADTPINARVKQ